MKTVFLTGLSCEFDRCLAEVFRREGWQVCVAGDGGALGVSGGEAFESIDLYVDVSDRRDELDTFSIRDGLDEGVIRSVYEANVLRPIEFLAEYLPLLDKGETRRICFISSREASINETFDASGYAYKMSKAAMHNMYMIAWNCLHADGYTFRVFDPLVGCCGGFGGGGTGGGASGADGASGGVDARAAAESAFVYFTARRGTENNDTLRDDENRLVMRDALGREHTW